METDTIDEIGETELEGEEIEFIEIKIERSPTPEEVLPEQDDNVETTVPLPPRTISPKPISDTTTRGQQVLFVYGTGTGEAIKFISASEQDPSDPSCPLTFRPAIETKTTSQDVNVLDLQPGKQIIMKKAVTANKRDTLTAKRNAAPKTVKIMTQPQKSTHQHKVSPSVSMKKAWCKACNKSMYDNSTLRRHVKEFHPGKLGELLPSKKKNDTVPLCKECGKYFSKQSNLTQHVKRFHTGGKIRKQKEYNHLCDMCGKSFTLVRNLKHHYRVYHTEGNEGTSDRVVKKRQKLKLKCPICRNDENFEKCEIWHHFETFHDIKLSSENMKFSCENEFYSWKSEIEKETKCHFVNEHGFDSAKDYKRRKFTCYRSGMYKPKGYGIKQLKAQGTNKISGFCPAEIVLKIFHNGECCVEFVNVHIGHDQDLGRLTLSKSERENIAAKIAAKVPFQSILDEVRGEYTSENKFERIHLLKRKDLHNIKQRLNLDHEEVRNPKDCKSIDVWIKEIEEKDCVLCYKPQDALSDICPELEPEDFLLIIMNQGQADFLKKNDSDVICIDITDSLNSDEFALVTLIVLDDMREGFPSAFFISNRTDETVMSIFFSAIKNKLGKNLEPKIFMSDTTQSLYTAWTQIMGPVKNRLISSWHVDRDWRENLRKISTEEKQIEVYKNLRILLQETDADAFIRMCDNFMEYLFSDSDTEEFGAYFRENYLNDVQSWAYWYRISCGINRDMHLEWMHRTLKQLKHIYFNGKAIKRLDKSINTLMKFVHDTLFDRLIVINKVKICTKMQAVRSRHKACEKLDDQCVNETETGFEVLSSTKNEVYFVQERQASCDCKILCTECQICLHHYSCTCIDSCIRLNMCKHIHLVCRFLKKHNTDLEAVDDDIPLSVESDDEKFLVNQSNPSFEQQKVLEAATIGKEKKDVDVEGKEKLKLKLIKLNELIDDINSHEDLNIIKEIVPPIEPTLVAMKEEKNPIFSIKIPNNKKIIVHRIEAPWPGV